MDYEKLYKDALERATRRWDADKKELKKIELVEQKPAEWSETDKLKMETIIHVISNQRGSAIFEGLLPEELINWLNDIKDRVLPQPKQEWSEDTQQWIDAIIKDYEGWYDADIDHRATIQAKINILKSLRPQSHWRPSEEQMNALKDALNDAIQKYDFKGSSIKEEATRKHVETIESLYEDLKKLMEE